MPLLVYRARDGTRTRGLDLGKVALHQLSHSRMPSLLDASSIISNLKINVNNIFSIIYSGYGIIKSVWIGIIADPLRRTLCSIIFSRDIPM